MRAKGCADQRTHRKIGDVMVVHDVEVHEIRACPYHRLHFFTQTREIGRQNTRSYAEGHAILIEHAIVARSLFVARARIVARRAGPRPPDNAEQQEQRDTCFEQQPQEFHDGSDGILAAMMMERETKIHSLSLRFAVCAPIVLAAACATAPSSPPTRSATIPPPVVPEKAPVAAPKVPSASTAPPQPSPATAPAQSSSGIVFRPAAWGDLPGWRDDQMSEAWAAFLASCAPLGSRNGWREACASASGMTNPGPEAVRRFFERAFAPWQIANADGSDEGSITGYYEPLLRGSRKPSGRYRFPVYGVPDDLVIVELGDIYPELKNMRLRGKLDGRRLVPYYDRARIENAQAPLRGKELVWVDDAIDLFFLHIQGSGRIVLESGETIRVGYADQNGYPYRSIGRLLVERGELTLEQASMQGIKAWARAHPDRVPELLNSNASYVFFRELPSSASGPPGSLGVPLTSRRSIAVDARLVPLGAPVYVATTWPNTTRPLNRLMLAQDTGGAIRGAVRADFFWGYGETAAREAGRMKQRLRMWVLLPQGVAPNPPSAQ